MTVERPRAGLARAWPLATAVLAATSAVVLLAGCVAAPSTPQSGPATPAHGQPPPATSTPAAPFDPSSLVGRWTVRGAADEWSGTVVQFDTQATLWRRCGSISFPYIAGPDSDLRVGRPESWGSDCGDRPTAAWLTEAAVVAHRGGDVLLLRADGRPTATLVPGGEPHVDENTSPELAAPPVLTPELRESLSWHPVTLPAGLVPAAIDVLAGGRWFPPDPPSGNPDGSWASFAEDGTWQGTDGCNGSGGIYTLDDGAVRATSGPSTLIGCDGVPVSSWVAQARALGLTSDGLLVLLDSAGTEIGRLIHR